LGRALQAKEVKESVDELSAPRQALLWARLAGARQRRGDTKGAVTAYQQAIALAPDSDGAMQARRALIEVWSADSERLDVIVEFRRILAADSLAPEDVIAYGRALCARGSGDGGRALLELAGAMGCELSNEDVSFLGLHPVRVM